MARVTDERENQNTNVNSDILGTLSGSVAHIDSTTSQIKADTATLKSIQQLLDSALNGGGRRFSQSSANDYMYGSRNSDYTGRSERAFNHFRDDQKDKQPKGGTRDVTRDARRARNNASGPVDPRDWEDFINSLRKSLTNFTEAFNDELEEGLRLADLSDKISKTTQDFAADLDNAVRGASKDLQRRTQAIYDQEIDTQRRKSTSRNATISSIFDDRDTRDTEKKVKTGMQRSQNAFEEFDDKLTEQFNKFSDGIANEFKDAIHFTDFSDLVGGALDDLAKSLGTDVEHLSEDFGRQMGQALFKESGLGDTLSNLTDRFRQSIMNNARTAADAFNRTRNANNPDGTSRMNRADEARERLRRTANPRTEAQQEVFARRDAELEAESQRLHEATDRTEGMMDRIREAQAERMRQRAESAPTAPTEEASDKIDAENVVKNAISNATEPSMANLMSVLDVIRINTDIIASNYSRDADNVEEYRQYVKEQLENLSENTENPPEPPEDRSQQSEWDNNNPLDNIDIPNPMEESQQGIDPTDLKDLLPNPVEEGASEIPQGALDIEEVGEMVDDLAGMFGNVSEGLANFLGEGLGGLGNMFESLAGSSTMLGQAAQGAATALGGGGAAAGAGAAGAGAAAGGLGAAVAATAGALLPVIAIGAALAIGFQVLQQRLEEATEQIKKSWSEFQEAFKKSSNFYFERQRKRIETAQERLQADIETMVKRPFEIMEAAAQDWYDAWDANLQMITGTQGYTKADLQDLMANYAERLRNEGLGDIVSAADMTEQLAKVLESGLSGTVAEEFAYLATKLNAAIPNQDFFGYASEYASVAANAIQAGYDQASAISLANAELEQFASNVLYASRMIAGGFSTGLQNASDLFAKANQIARSAGMLDSSNISGVLTSVMAAVSAVAPQLADGLVNAVVDAAIGDNSETLTALRSLANTGASTTAFLREFANDPQKIFTEIFKNLSNLQKMNKDNYMEVAQSLSGIFGIDAAAFSQIDFGSLANSVSSMKVNTDALDENMTLLGSGQTTTNDEQLKMQQINEMILNEGLSYVLDNQAARAIQQHMWDQELAQELMENTYGVELEGATFKLLEGIKETVHNIFNILNPFSWVEKAMNVASVVAQTESMKADIKRMLELGKVGAGNAEAFEKLTTYTGEMLNNVDDLVSMMEGTSGANLSGMSSSKSVFASVLGMFKDGANAMYDASYALSHPVSFSTRQVKALSASLKDAITQSSMDKSPASQYNWAYVGKSVANALQNTDVNASAMAYTGPTALAEAQSLQEAIAEDAAAQMEAFLETMEEAAKYQVEWEEDRTGRKIPTGNVSAMSYDEWKETAADFGIEDLEQALEDYGMTEEQLQGAYQDYQAAAVSEYNWQREMYEWAFWEAGINFWENAFPDEYRDPLFERFDHLLELTTHIDEVLTYWEDLWQYDWFYQSWSSDWMIQAWNKDWLHDQWNENWLKAAWQEDWLTDRWDEYWDAWMEWYFEHEVYSEETGQAYQASDVVNANADYTGDAILALAAALTQNTIDLKDPTVQTNALLAQILIVTEAIMQAENTSGSAALATTLAGLSLGLEG